MAGVLPLIVFNFTPDTTAHCCIAPRSGCPTGALPCVCFRDAEDLHGVSEWHTHVTYPPSPPPFAPGLYNETAARDNPHRDLGLPAEWTRPLDAFSPEYALACAARVNYTLSEAVGTRADACGLEGGLGRDNVQTWRFAIAAGCALQPSTCNPMPGLYIYIYVWYMVYTYIYYIYIYIYMYIYIFM